MNQQQLIPANLIGVPIDLGAKNLGVDIGPDAFRYQDIVGKLTSAGLQINDLGNVPCIERSKADIGNDPKHKYLPEILKIASEVARQTEATIRQNRKAIVLGGDHSLTLGTVSGASAAVGGNLGVIYIDAHGDMNTDDTTLSGNVHGMHLASLMGFGARQLIDVYAPGRKFKPADLVHLAGCDFDQAETDLMLREHMPNFSMLDLMRHGIGPALDLIDALAARVDNVWVSMDLDSIDSIYAPGAGMPNAKGLSYREIAAIAEHAGQACNVVGIDVVEYNPLQDIERKTAELGTELIATFLGKTYSWYSHYMAHNKL